MKWKENRANARSIKAVNASSRPEQYGIEYVKMNEKEPKGAGRATSGPSEEISLLT